MESCAYDVEGSVVEVDVNSMIPWATTVVVSFDVQDVADPSIAKCVTHFEPEEAEEFALLLLDRAAIARAVREEAK